MRFSRAIIGSISLFAIITVLILFTSYSCRESSQDNQHNSNSKIEEKYSITEQEILDAQKAWEEGIIKIGTVFIDGGDYNKLAMEHINNFYNYQEGRVLFKPTLASEKQFRTDFKGALSYFVGGDENYPEDHGFALKPWKSVRWESAGINIYGNIALAMGNYYFTASSTGDIVKVEYSFAYIKDKEGKIKIILHDSHIPYTPMEKH